MLGTGECRQLGYLAASSKAANQIVIKCVNWFTVLQNLSSLWLVRPLQHTLLALLIVCVLIHSRIRLQTQRITQVQVQSQQELCEPRAIAAKTRHVVVLVTFFTNLSSVAGRCRSAECTSATQQRRRAVVVIAPSCVAVPPLTLP